MGWSSKWLIVVSGPAEDVERFKQQYTEIWAWYPYGDCGAWQRVGINLKRPYWTLRSVFEREEAEDEKAEALREGREYKAPEAPQEIIFCPKDEKLSTESLSQKCIRKLVDSSLENPQQFLQSFASLPDELKQQVFHHLNVTHLRSLSTRGDADELQRLGFPTGPVEAQLIYDMSLNKGYQIFELEKLSRRIPEANVDVAFWTQSDGCQHTTIQGGGQMSYSIESEDISEDFSYKSDFFINVDEHVPESKGWTSFDQSHTKPDYIPNFCNWIRWF